MKGWDWLTQGTYRWGFVIRVLLKALLLFGVFNVAWLALQPLPALASLSVHGWLVPYRERLPYGETPDANNLSTNSLEAMFATHALRAPKASDEFRVIVIGDSATWGILLTPEQTLTGQLNNFEMTTQDGRQIRFYNAAHPIMSLTKDLMLLDIARQYDTDLIIWLNTLESFFRPEQLEPPILRNNAARVHELVTRYDLDLDVSTLPVADLFEQSFLGQRRLVADWWRLQAFGVAWATTGIDQVYPDYTPRSSDYEEDFSWKMFQEPTELNATNALAFDVIAAAHAMMGDVPILLVNEPIFISEGRNSQIRYNFWYPKWAYDQYRVMYQQQADANNWLYSDLWNITESSLFTDSPVHMNATGVGGLAESLAPIITNTIIQIQGDTP